MTGSLPDETRIGRVALRATDPDRLAEFYAGVVGLSVLGRDEKRTVLGAGGDPLVVLEAAPEAPDRSRSETGLFHLAIRVPDRASLAAVLARVEDGWSLDGASDHRVSEALYLTDPEDNGLEVYRDRPREEWPENDDGTVAMDTLPLDLDDLRSARTDDPAASVDADADGGRVPPETDVGHVHLEVSDLGSAETFYDAGLGLDVRARYGGAALFLAAGGYHHHVGVNTWNGRTGPGPGRGLAWWELLVPDRAALAAVRRRLTAGDDGFEARTGGAAVDLPDDGFVVTDPDELAVAVRIDRSGE